MIGVKGKSDSYKEQQIMTASPLELIIIAYDVAINSCVAEDLERALRALSLLRGSLNYDAAPEISQRLYAIYAYCEECVREKDYNTAGNLLRELRSGWEQLRRQSNTNSVNKWAATPQSRPVTASVLNLAG